MKFNEMNTQQRAAYLLSQGIEAKFDIDPTTLTPGFSAHVVGIGKLPCGYYESEQAATDAGIDWLLRKMEPDSHSS